MRTAIFFVSILFSGVVLADCDDVDLSVSVASPRKVTATMNQGQSPYCFAFVASSLMSQKLGLKANDPISVLDVLSNHYAHLDGYYSTHSLQLEPNRIEQAKYTGVPFSRRSGGSTLNAIAFYNERRGACLESQLHSMQSQVFRDSDDFLLKRLQEIEGPGEEREIQWPKTKGARKSNLIERASSGSMSAFYEGKWRGDAVKAVDAKIDRLCHPRIPAPRFTPHFLTVSGETEIREAMEQVSKNLRQGRATELTIDTCVLHHEKCPGKDKGLHAMMIIGQRKRGSTCEYRIRNSWGTSCKTYVKALQKRCVYGDLWLPQNEVKAGMREIIWID